jgi:hypothetical protein
MSQSDAPNRQEKQLWGNCFPNFGPVYRPERRGKSASWLPPMPPLLAPRRPVRHSLGEGGFEVPVPRLAPSTAQQIPTPARPIQSLPDPSAFGFRPSAFSLSRCHACRHASRNSENPVNIGLSHCHACSPGCRGENFSSGFH